MEKNRIDYIEYLRAIAILAVVAFHVKISNETVESVVSYCLNFCVPVFVMISGALFLDPRKNTSILIILKKYVFKIVVVILIWGSIYNFFSLSLISGFSAALPLKAIWMVICADITYCYQFWYLYLLIGLYLIIPMIKPWTDRYMNSETPTKECFIMLGVFFFASIVLKTLLSILGIEVNHFWCGAFIPFSGFVFYLISGYWVKRFGLTRIMRIVFFIIVCSFTVVAIICWINNSINFVDTISGYTSLVTCSMSVLLFDFIKGIRLSEKHKLIDRLLKRISFDSFGIYIFHVAFLVATEKLFQFFHLPTTTWWFSILQFCLTIVLSIVTTEIMKKIPFLCKYV